MGLPEVNQEHSGKMVTSLKSSGERTHETRTSLLLCVGIRVIHQSQRSRNLDFLVSCAVNTSFMVAPTGQCQFSRLFLSPPLEAGAASVPLQLQDLNLRVSDDQESNRQLRQAAVPVRELPAKGRVN